MTAGLDARFRELRSTSATGLITYVTAGDPDRARSERILRALDSAGADVLEVGVPFSDPVADGPVIQRASERALAGGMTLASTLDLIGRVRAAVRAPVVVFTYANPVLRMGLEEFARRASGVGVDGVLVLDLPIEEADGLRDTLEGAGLAPIFLLSPTTTRERIVRAAALGRGFLYAISRLGVTGVSDRVSDGARTLAARIRDVTTMPLAMGFGISHPDHVAEVGQWADAAVVGSGLVALIAEHGASADLEDRVRRYVQWLKSGTRVGERT